MILKNRKNQLPESSLLRIARIFVPKISGGHRLAYENL